MAFTMEPSPPILAEHFSISYLEHTPLFQEPGKLYYDAGNDRQRIDHPDANLTFPCRLGLPNVSTPCTEIARDDKLFLIYP